METKIVCMKKWVTLLAATALIASCSKQDLQQETANQTSLRTVTMRGTQGGAYVSEWETNGDWVKTDISNNSRFTWTRKVPEISSDVLNGGVVLTYSKFASSDPAYARFANPTALPYYYLPEAERPLPQTYYFSQDVSSGEISISYTVPYTKEAMPKMNGGASLSALRFQTIALPKSFLDARNVTAAMVLNYYSYEQVMSLINQ